MKSRQKGEEKADEKGRDSQTVAAVIQTPGSSTYAVIGFSLSVPAFILSPSLYSPLPLLQSLGRGVWESGATVTETKRDIRSNRVLHPRS